MVLDRKSKSRLKSAKSKLWICYKFETAQAETDIICTELKDGKFGI